MEKEKLCLRCMRKIGNNTVCPYCRNESNKPQESPLLPLKTVVGSRYLVGKATSTNAAGSTYNAFDLQLKKPVTLHELFPKGVLTRGEGNYCLVNVGKASEFIDAKESFVTLFKKLSTIKGYTALVNVEGVFEDFGTVYAVSDFLGEGQSLREYLLNKEQGYISWDEARVLLMPVVSALGELHANGIIHGAVSPTNLIIDKKGKVKISGFSVPEVRTEKSNMEAELFEGYAAVEQYGLSSGIGPCTDIYGFAAVLYRTLIGSTPMSASSRLTNDKLMIPGKFAEQLPAYVINALVNALQILPEERTPSIELLRNELSASPAAAGTAAEAYSSIYNESKAQYEEEEIIEDYDVEEPQETVQETKIKRSTVVAFAVSAVLFLAILLVVFLGFKGCTKNDDETAGTTQEQTEDVNKTDDESESGFKSIKLPDFKGEVYDEIKNDSEYKSVLIFITEYVDSAENRGTVVSQSINPGTEVNSINPKKIILKISNGYEVPDVIDENLKDAIQKLEDAGFKNIESDSAKVAGEKSESNKVYSITYEDPKTGDWVEIPSDGRLSASDHIILYYYGEFEETTEQTTVSDTPVDVTVTDESTEVSTESQEIQ